MKGKGFTASLMRKESPLGFDFCGLCVGGGTANPVFKAHRQPCFGILSSFVLNTELDPKDQARGHASQPSILFWYL